MYFGVIYAVFNIVALIASRYTHVFIDKTKPKTLIILSYFLLFSFILLGIIKHPIGIVAIFLMQIYRGLNGTVYNKHINKNTESDRRATVLSFFSLFSTLLNAGFAIVIGLILNYFNIFNTFLIIAGVLGGILIIMNKVLNKNLC